MTNTEGISVSCIVGHNFIVVDEKDDFLHLNLKQPFSYGASERRPHLHVSESYIFLWEGVTYLNSNLIEL